MSKVLAPRDMRHTFIDLYAGCGGFSLGLVQAGMKCLAAVEYDAIAASSYWYNLCYEGWSSFKILEDENKEKITKVMAGKSETKNWLFPEPPDDYWLCSEEPSPTLNLYCCDILKLEPENIMETIGFKPGELGVIVGGPPCQGFSTANSFRSEDDARNKHPFRFLHYVKVMQPHYFIIENVPGILSMGKKKGDKEGPFPKWIIQTAKEAGYNVTYDIHNAMNYGVPQSRRRVLFVGVRNDLYESGKRFELPEQTNNYDFFDKDGYPVTDVPLEKEPYVTVAEAIGDLNSLHLSSWRDSDAKKKPFGSMDRATGGGNGKDKRDKGDTFHWKGRYYYNDRFNGLYFNSNAVNELNLSNEYYFQCPYCDKVNLKIRRYCHYCKTMFEPYDKLSFIMSSEEGTAPSQRKKKAPQRTQGKLFYLNG